MNARKLGRTIELNERWREASARLAPRTTRYWYSRHANLQIPWLLFIGAAAAAGDSRTQFDVINLPKSDTDEKSNEIISFRINFLWVWIVGIGEGEKQRRGTSAFGIVLIYYTFPIMPMACRSIINIYLLSSRTHSLWKWLPNRKYTNDFGAV